MDFDLDKLPKWALPVALGGGLGLVVLLTRNRGSSSSFSGQPVPVYGQGPGSGSGGTDTALNQVLGAITDSLSAGQDANAAAQAQQQTMFQAFSENIAALIGSNQSGSAQQFAGLLEAFEQQQNAIRDQLNAVVNRPAPVTGTGGGPTTQTPGIIDQLKASFTAAFSRRPTPANGTSAPGSGIVVNEADSWRYYEQTGHYVARGFLAFMESTGGAGTYGVPLSEEFRDTDGYTTQVFSKAIFKHKPGSNPGAYDVDVIWLN